MVQFILITLSLLSFTARADFFGLGSDKGYQSRITPLVEKLKALEMANNPSYEDLFNQSVKNIELGIEEEKLFCSGEAADPEGRTLPKEQKQLCFRELKTKYLEAMDVVFNLKKKYLAQIHTKHMERLGEIQKKLRSDIEKSF